MSAEEALRFLAYQAADCREKEMHEALCLLLPALLKVLALQEMNPHEAEIFRRKFKLTLQTKCSINKT